MEWIKKHLFNGLAWGCIAVVGNLVVFHLLDLAILGDIWENFTAFSIGVILVSMAFISTGGMIYETKKLSFGLKLLIHIFVGIGTLLVVGFTTRVFTFENITDIFLNIGINFFILLIVWVYFYMRDKREVEEINANLRDKRQQRARDIE